VALALTGIIAFAAAIRLYDLGGPSLWIDEAWSYTNATMPMGALWHLIATRETNSALFFLFLRTWIGVFGTSEVAMRLPSFLASIATIPLVYAAGERLFGRKAGLIAAVLFGLSPLSTWYARDVRGYSPEIMFVTAGLLFLLRALERPTAANLAGWAICDVLAFFAHALSITAIPAQILPMLMLDRREVPWRRLLTTAAIMMTVLVPMMLLFRHNDHGQLAWIPALSWSWVGGTIFGIANGIAPDPSGQMVVAAYFVGAVCGFVATIRALDRSRAEAMPFVLAASGVLLPFILVTALSFAKPSLYYRYLIFSLPCLCLFVAGGIAALRTRVVAVVVLAGLIAGSAWQTWYMLERAPRFDWRQPALYIMLQASPGDRLAVRYGPNRMALDYYFARLGMPPGLVVPVFPDWAPDGYVDGRYPEDPDQAEFMANRLLAKIDSTAAQGRRLWFLIDGESMGSFDQWAPLNVIEQRLSADYKSVQSAWVETGFTVILCSDPRLPPQRTP